MNFTDSGNNFSNNTSVIDLILENEDALVILTPLTIGCSTSVISNCDHIQRKIEEADNNDENIYAYLSVLNSELGILRDGLALEIQYLERHLSKDKVEDEYNKLLSPLSKGSVNFQTSK